MSAIFSAPIWLLYLALAIPMLFVSSIALSWQHTHAGMPRYYATMTDQQGRLISTSSSHSGVVFYFGPMAIAANARSWAAIAVMTGLLLTGIGMIGLLHFPTRQPIVNHESANSMTENFQGDAQEPDSNPVHLQP